jgi:hypothetical protein
LSFSEPIYEDLGLCINGHPFHTIVSDGVLVGTGWPVNPRKVCDVCGEEEPVTVHVGRHRLDRNLGGGLSGGSSTMVDLWELYKDGAGKGTLPVPTGRNLEILASAQVIVEHAVGNMRLRCNRFKASDLTGLGEITLQQIPYGGSDMERIRQQFIVPGLYVPGDEDELVYLSLQINQTGGPGGWSTLASHGWCRWSIT